MNKKVVVEMKQKIQVGDKFENNFGFIITINQIEKDESLSKEPSQKEIMDPNITQEEAVEILNRYFKNWNANSKDNSPNNKI